MKSLRCCSAICSALGPLLILWGGLLYLTFPYIYDFIINSVLDVSPGSPTYNEWRITDPRMIMDMYLFNWTNAEEVNNPEVKPRFEQLGPYRFRKVKEKLNVTVHGNETVSYVVNERFYFVGAESPAQLTDVVTTINAVALTAAYRSRFVSKFKKFLLSVTLEATSKAYVTKTAGELLFDGYEDYLMDTVRPLSPFLGLKVVDKFGFFYQRNNSQVNDPYTVHLGHDENFGKLTSWKNRPYSTSYTGKCGELRGSSGEFFPMNKKRDYLEVFLIETCSAVYLGYEQDVVIEGIHGYRFNGKTMFNFETPERSCFCPDKCGPPGALNASICAGNSPVFVSLPHFYHADPFYTSLIEGMKPVRENHDFYITLEPKSSIPYDSAARAQVNMLLQPIPGISMYENVPTAYIPVMYLDQTFRLRDELLMKIYLVQKLPVIVYILCALLLFLGMILTIWSLVKMCRAYRESGSSKTKMYFLSN